MKIFINFEVMNNPFSDENKNQLREPNNFFLRDALAFAPWLFLDIFSWKNQFKYFIILLQILDDKISTKKIYK